MAHTHHHPIKLFIRTCQLKVLSFRQVLISFVSICPPSNPSGATFWDGWKLHQLQVSVQTAMAEVPLCSHPNSLQTHLLRQIPTSLDCVAPFEDVGTLNALLGPCHFEFRELYFDIYPCKVPTACRAPVFQRDAPACPVDPVSCPSRT